MPKFKAHFHNQILTGQITFETVFYEDRNMLSFL